VFVIIAELPIATLTLPVVIAPAAFVPIATLFDAVVAASKA
jgi:hypothetical protein